MSQPINVYDANDPAQMSSAVQDLQSVLAATPTVQTTTPTDVISVNPDLLGIEQEVYDLINQTLAVKKHLMFYGPPGTGKTTLAEHIADIVGHGDYVLVTGTSDWTSQDLIGGYQPTGNGSIKFAKGLILENFDRPIIIDELNRVDIDKAIGPLFTVLSGQQTTLPYQLEPDSSDPNRQKRINILPQAQASLAYHQFAPSDTWRLLATINSVDKASLYQMSYALSRRFGWILIDVPKNLDQFIIDFLVLRAIISQAPAPGGTVTVLSRIWAAVNNIRAVGAAPIIDIIFLCTKADPAFDFFQPPSSASNALYINGFYTFLLPLLDGILQVEADKLSSDILTTLSINTGDDLAEQIKKRITYHSI